MNLNSPHGRHLSELGLDLASPRRLLVQHTAERCESRRAGRLGEAINKIFMSFFFFSGRQPSPRTLCYSCLPDETKRSRNAEAEEGMHSGGRRRGNSPTEDGGRKGEKFSRLMEEAHNAPVMIFCTRAQASVMSTATRKSGRGGTGGGAVMQRPE